MEVIFEWSSINISFIIIYNGYECFEFINIWSFMKHVETSGIKFKKKSNTNCTVTYLAVEDRNMVLVANKLIFTKYKDSKKLETRDYTV